MVNIRQLTQEDTQQWESIRLEMLKQVPEAFGSSFEEDSLLSGQAWQESLVKSMVDNTKALALYERHGFVKVGVEPRALKVGDQFYDEILMVKELARD